MLDLLLAFVAVGVLVGVVEISGVLDCDIIAGLGKILAISGPDDLFLDTHDVMCRENVSCYWRKANAEDYGGSVARNKQP